MVTPVAGGHFFDEAAFDAVAGLVLVEMLLVDDLELLRVLAIEDNAFGEEAVASGVFAGAAFARFRYRSPGEGTASPGCFLFALRP
jgi:hypothetical protein